MKDEHIIAEQRHNKRFFLITLFGFFLFIIAARADYKDDIDQTRLASELGAALPSGTNISVSHIEASLAGGEYMPETNDVEFAGKAFTAMSGSPTNASEHASIVGRIFYGRYTSVAPDINVICNYSATDWLGTGFLRTEDSAEPKIETNRVQNHSWVWATSSSFVTNSIRRLDYAIERDGFVAVVGLANSSTTAIPHLLAHSYNAISVGKSSGEHSTSGTVFDVAGRVKPEIVVPVSTESAATPIVSACAAMLLETCDADAGLTNAAHPECIKAILMAGATKEEFSTWDRLSYRPLDDRYGAGELNIYNSYHVLVAGEKEACATSLVDSTGWDFDSLPGGSNMFYFFDVPANYVMTRLSVVLTWNRIITNGPAPGFDPYPALSDMNMYLYGASNFSITGIVDLSTGRIDNVEHIYQRHLAAGRYALEVKTDSSTDYALAWYSRTALIPVIQSICITNGNIRFDAAVSSNINCSVQSSTNLVSSEWQYIATNYSSTNVWTYIDANSTNFSRRFYRLIPDP